MDTIKKFDDNAKLIGMHEVIIHEEQPDGLHKFMSAVCQHLSHCRFFEDSLIKILDCVCKLFEGYQWAI